MASTEGTARPTPSRVGHRPGGRSLRVEVRADNHAVGDEDDGMAALGSLPSSPTPGASGGVVAPAGPRTESPSRRKLRTSIRTAQVALALAREAEGANAHFAGVPPWIRHERIPGMKYRRVVSVQETVDFFHDRAAGVKVHGDPGVPAWAEGVGPVAVQYSGGGGPPGTGSWAVFRKLLPFTEQGAGGDPERLLFLGAGKWVRRTTRDVMRVREGTGDCLVIQSDGVGPRAVALASLRPRERYRLWLAWASPSSGHADRAASFKTVCCGACGHAMRAQLMSRPRTLADVQARGRDSLVDGVLRGLQACALVCGGYDSVTELWTTQPYRPPDPDYYRELVARTLAGHERAPQQAL